MRRTYGQLVVNTFVTLDGVMQAPGMPDEDRDGPFTHGGWQVPAAATLNRAPKYVASRTLDAVARNNSTLIKGNLAEEARRLKGEHNEIEVIGSGKLVQTLMQHDLVDRYNVWVYPLLGSGKRLFAEGTVPTALRLVDSRIFSSGAVVLSYQPAGKPMYGSAAGDSDQRH